MINASSPVAKILERLYERFHRPEFIHPDPVELVWAAAPEEREVVALIASSLALGRVESILSAVRGVLARLESPRAALESMNTPELRRLFRGFRYRFFSDEQLVRFLGAIGEALRSFGTLEACFASTLSPNDRTVREPLVRFVETMGALGGGDMGILLSDPSKGSACKRLHLYLRWMVRRDAIDPGCWGPNETSGTALSPKLLLVPVDVHMLRVSRLLGLTTRRQPDLAASLEITSALAEIDRDDPVRFDFSMTRLGIHPDLSYDDLVESVR